LPARVIRYLTWTIGSSATSYFDFGLENGTTYRYRLYYIFSGTAGSSFRFTPHNRMIGRAT